MRILFFIGLACWFMFSSSVCSLATVNTLYLPEDLFLSAKKIRKTNRTGPSGQRPVLIDVRTKSEFDSFRIPESLNLPLYAVKTKTALRSRTIVLLNEGYHTIPLIKECIKLRKRGFNAFILYGGLNSWWKSKGRIHGDYFGLENVNKMPPQVWYSEQKNNHWLLIDSSEIQSKGVGAILPEAIHIPYSENPDIFKEKINTILATRQHIRFTSVLIFNEAGRGYEDLENKLPGLAHLFFLKNGLNGYAKFIEKQALIWSRDKKKKFSTRKCDTCS